MRIGFFTPSWPGEKTPNGITTSTANVVYGLTSLGRQPAIFTPKKENDDVFAFEIPPSRPLQIVEKALVRLGRPKPIHRSFAAAIARSVAEVGGGDPIDALLMEESFGWAGFVQEQVDLPVCVVLRGPHFLHKEISPLQRHRWFNRDREIWEGEALEKCAAVIAPSQNVMDLTLRHYGASPKWRGVFPNPMRPKAAVDAALFDQDGPLEILFVGRFDTHKGGDILIDAFELVIARGVDARLTFVGPDRGVPGPDGGTQSLEARLARLPEKVRMRINPLGKCDKGAIDQLRRTHPVTLVPSRYENFPNTVTEAMAAGSALVASDAGGIAEIVRRDETGLLAGSGDASAFADAVVRLANDRPLARRLGAAARQHIEQALSPEGVAERLTRFLTDVVEDYRNRR